MPIQYRPIPEFETPNLNLMGSFAQGQAFAANALQQQRLEQQMRLAEAAAGYAANKDIREADKLQAEQQAKEFEIASKKYDYLVNMTPRINAQNYPSWRKQVTETFPLAAATLPETYDPQSIQMIAMQGADMKPQIMQQHFGDTSRFIQINPLTRKASIVEGSEATAMPKYVEVKQGDNIVGYRPERGGGIISPEEFDQLQYTMGREGTGKNPRSSAQGVGQFIDSTFVDTYRKTFPDRAKGMSKEAILAQRGTKIDGQTPIEEPMLQAFTAANQQRLRDAGFEPSKGNTYLAHFAGPDGAIDVLSASPDTPVTELLSPRAIKSNPEVFAKAKTAGDLIRWAGGAGGGATKAQEAGIREPLKSFTPAPIGTEEAAGQKSALKFLDAIEYNPETGASRPAQLMESVGGGRPTQVLYGLARAFGVSTEGTRGEARLSSSQKNALLDKVGGSLGGKSFTDEDRKFVMEAIGGLDDTAVPVGDRLAKFDEAVRMLSRRAGVPYKEAPQLSRLRNNITTPEGAAATRGKAGGEEMVTIDIPGQGPHKFPASVADKVRAAIAARGGR
jgi:hypothetical protein